MKKIILVLLIVHCTLLIAEAQWIQQNSGTSQNLYDVEFINDKTGWAVGDAGVVIKTTNGGTNWINVPNPSGQYGGLMWSICPVDSEVVYAVAGYDFIMKTSNGGLNWNVLSGRIGSTTAFKGVYFLNRDTGWFLGSYKVFRTYDGGNTLDSFYAPWFTNSDIYFKNIDTGIFCGEGRVFKSTDGGMNWLNSNVPTIGVFYAFRKLAVIDNNVWVSGSGNPPVYKSTDFCETWEVTDTIRNTGIIGLNFANRDIGFAGGGLNKLFKTTNGGNNWYQENTNSGVVAFISSIDFLNKLTGWYVCGAGKIFHTTTGGQTMVNIFPVEENFPVKFELYQNFPNPFNSETKIEFKIYEDNYYSLEIFDLLGKKLDHIINEKLAKGNYKFRYNPQKLSSGIYIYRLSTAKDVLQRKFILLK